ncbi:MAG: hypothetical protein LBS91_09015, partial [Clostridiales Family XIII bacterium]|nr:hypothetical protein [Clostridiales Family XIII bacterium]
MYTLSHAVIVEGGSAEARAEKAIELLKGHFADDPASAVKLDCGTFEDLIVLSSEDGKDVTVDKIEGLIELFKQKPFASTGKACLIEDGERMNEHAQNKLLKLLEEPAAGDVILILTGNAQRLLMTVRSRCVRIRLGYADPVRGPFSDDLRALMASLVYDRGTLAETNAILAHYESSRDEAGFFLSAFQIFLRDLSVGRICPALIGDMGQNGAWLAEKAPKIQKKHADRMQTGVLLA